MPDPKPLDEPIVRVNNPLALIDKMLDKGTDPVALGKMMDLAERWKAARAKEKFSEAMTTCQAEMPSVVKDADNPHTKSRFASLEAVNTTIKPCYTRHGFSIMFGEEDSPIAGCCRVTATLLHAGGHEKVFHADIPLDGTGIKGAANMTGTQGKGSTFAYGRRYLTLLIFNVTVAAEDTDGNVSEGERLTATQISTLDSLIADLKAVDPAFKLEGFARYMLGLGKDEDIGKQTWANGFAENYGPGVEMLMLKIKAKKAGGK